MDCFRPGAAFIVLCVACVNVGAEVAIEGLEGELLANALAHLSVDDEPCDAPEWRLQRLFRQGPREIRVAAQALGYYAVDVTAKRADKPDCWYATFSADIGEPVRVRKLQVSIRGDGSKDSVITRRLVDAKIQEGRVFRHDHYEELKRSLLEVASRRGYADAELGEHSVSVYPEQLAADVTVAIDTGRRYNFGAVTYKQDVLNQELVERYASFRRGEPYNSRRLAELYSALAGSGYFERVEIDPMLDARAENEIPITVTMTPGNRIVYTAGVGFSTNTGPRLRAGYNNRRLGRKGHQWGANALLSNVVSEIAVNYRLPMGDPNTEWLSFDGGYKHEETDTSTSDAYQVGLRQIKQRAHKWQEARFIDYVVEEFEIGQQRDTTKLIIPGISWSRTRADNRLRPDSGLHLFLEFRGSADAFGSDTNFLRMESRLKWVRRIWKSSRVIARADLGASLTDEFSELPPSVRFFAGGDASVRGYDYETLGPKDAMGDVIGGSNKFVASLEYERDLNDKWSVATFVDSGNAFDDFDFQPQTGAGIGLRWQSPVGPVRVDLAKPMNGGDRSVRLHVSFGPDL